MESEWMKALGGGAIIGVASLILLAFNGRIFGVSGIVGIALSKPKGETSWRVSAILGLLLGGLVMSAIAPEAFQAPNNPLWLSAIAGLLVGYGTRLGNGCTSGHGICGISRLSVRSIAATVTFLLFGFLAATLSALLGS